LEKDFSDLNDETFELAAASIGMVNLDTNEPLPAHLRSKIEASAEQYFAPQKASAPAEKPAEQEEFQKTFAFKPKRGILDWLGWAVAAVACVALAVNLYLTRVNPTNVAGVNPTPTATPEIKLTPAQEMERFLASNPDVVRSSWGDFDPKKPMNVKGDVVWSNAAQKGYIRFTNIPVNDKTKEQYQLWIFDANQKHPIDGGVFDAGQAGEIIVPIDAKINVQKPTMFAVTAEKPGGVVVSPLEKVMAVAKLST
jgi:anti-sigma-K factor RskA